MTSNPRSNLAGKTFGKLTATKYVSGSKWMCLCSCGNIVNVTTAKLKSGHTKSCGCLREEVGKNNKTHGKRNTPEYSIWVGMRQRCSNKNNKWYQKYGGRGITVEWSSFQEFIHDMGERPTPEHTIERIDVDGNYSNSNCCWTNDLALQAINQNLKSNNTSGKSGVYWRANRNRWVAKIFHGGAHVMLGSFVNIEDAIECRKEAERKYYGFEKPDGVG